MTETFRFSLLVDIDAASPEEAYKTLFVALTSDVCIQLGWESLDLCDTSGNPLPLDDIAESVIERLSR